MKCIKCGNELVENAQFCTNCGASQEQSTQPINPVYEQPAPNTVFPNQQPMASVPKKSKADVSFIMKLVMNAVGALSGVISIIFGIVIACKDCGSHVYANSYGGDAYTGIQNAAADTANNVYISNQIIKEGFCFICITIGLVAISYFASKLINVLLAKKEENK